MVNVLVHVLKGMKEKRAINITIILECRHQKIISSRPATQKRTICVVIESLSLLSSKNCNPGIAS